MMELLSYKDLLVIIHVGGVILGVGGAIMSDVMFFSSIKDFKLNLTEIRFMRLGSRMVWVGIGILVVSGSLLYLTDPTKYSESVKFLSKMTIVAIIIVNGIFFHTHHFPRMKKHTGKHLPSSDDFVKKMPILLMSGTISMVSWGSAFILGSLKSLPFSYITVMIIYLVLVGIAIIIAINLKKKIFLS